MKMRWVGLVILSAMVAIAGCSSGNDNGEEGSVIGLAPTGDSSTDITIPEEEEGQVILAFGSGESDSFADGQLGTAQGTLSAGGQTTINATVVNSAQNNQLVIGENTVTFTSSCAEQGLATITGSVTSASGSFNAIYTANGCVGVDAISATLLQSGGVSLAASGVVTVASGEVGGIQFESIDNPILSIKDFGSSSRPESTLVRFRVVDSQGLPVTGSEVSFTLSNNVGGTALQNTTAEVDSLGFAVANVLAGRVNTTVAVTARVEDGEAQGFVTTSDSISISTGLPDQNSFSVSASDLAPRAADWDGTEVSITIRGADAYNNPVRDGTIVNFRTEAGSIQPSCSTVGGACSVTWVSQDPRPLNFADNLPQSNAQTGDARAVITAYTEGEEYLRQDLNGNGLMDPNEPFEPLPEVFEDFNSDGAYDITEGVNGFDEYVDFNGNATYDGIPADPADQFFKGLRCSEDAINAGHCAETIQVRDSLQLCIAGSDPVIGNIFSTGANSFSYTVTDQFTNSLPSGSTITLSAENAEIVGGSTQVGPTGSALGSCNNGFTDVVTIVPDPDATEAPSVTISVTAGQSGFSISQKVGF